MYNEHTPEEEEDASAPTIPFVDDLGVQPALELGDPTPDLVEVAGDDYNGGHLSNGDEQPED